MTEIRYIKLWMEGLKRRDCRAAAEVKFSEVKERLHEVTFGGIAELGNLPDFPPGPDQRRHQWPV